MYDEIVKAIEASYKDWNNPNFSFIQQTYDDKIYSEVMEEISTNLSIKEDTDLNNDFSFVYYLSKGRQTYFLRISMVGKFAILLDTEDQLVTNSRGNDKYINLICKTLQKHKIELLDKNILLTKTNLVLPLTKQGEVNIYRALFEDTEFVPFR